MQYRHVSSLVLRPGNKLKRRAFETASPSRKVMKQTWRMWIKAKKMLTEPQDMEQEQERKQSQKKRRGKEKWKLRKKREKMRGDCIWTRWTEETERDGMLERWRRCMMFVCACNWKSVRLMPATTSSSLSLSSSIDISSSFFSNRFKPLLPT